MKLEKVKQWYIDNKKLFFASIEITPKCNFKCKHCYCAFKSEDEMSFDKFKVIIDKLHNEGCLFLNLTGGEIFTHRRFSELYRYAKDKGFIVDLLTNGSLINQEHIEIFKKLPPHNIAITLYGTNPEEYRAFTGENSFDSVLKTMDMLKDNNIHFVIRTIAARTLKDSIKNGRFNEIATKYRTTFKYDPIIFPMTSGNQTPVRESLSVEEIVDLEYSTECRKCAWEEMISEGADYKWTCQAGTCSLAIDHKGVAYVCGLYREKGISMVEEDTRTVLAFLSDIHNKHNDIVENGECSKCVHRNYCKWCPAYSYIYNLTTNKKITFFCQLAEKRRTKFGGK